MKKIETTKYYTFKMVLFLRKKNLIMMVNKHLTIFLILSVFMLFSYVSVSQAATLKAASVSYADVSAAVEQARSGDTVIVPAGSAIWNSPLIITKGMTLQGAGIGNTVIISNITAEQAGIIKYAPASPSLNEPFRITGFTLDGNKMSNCIYLYNPTVAKINKIRIDHNRIINAGGAAAGRAIYIRGTVYGVIDNNIIDSKIGPSSYGLDGTSWKSLPRSFGSADNIYYEDNYISGNDVYHYNGQGGRFVARYNTYSGADRNLYSMMDMHGNQPGGIYATMIGEVYGNLVHMNGYNGALLGHRGGQALVFFNYISNAGSFNSVRVVEEYNDNLTGDGYVQRVTNSYYWNNRMNSNKLITAYILTPGQCDDSCPGGGLYEHSCGYCVSSSSNFFDHNESFNGTSGTGCGTLANRPATCTPGVGYWATEQSCTDLTGMVGANPATPISGTLYKCVASNTWAAYFTPYTYPHPLRSGVTPSSGLEPPSGFRVIAPQ